MRFKEFLIKDMKAERRGRWRKLPRRHNCMYTFRPRSALAVGIPGPDLVIVVPAISHDGVAVGLAGMGAADGSPLAVDTVPCPQIVTSGVRSRFPRECDLAVSHARCQLLRRRWRRQQFGFRAGRKIEAVHVLRYGLSQAGQVCA